MKYGIPFFTFLFAIFSGSAQNPLNQIDSLMKSYYRPNDPGAVIAVTLNEVTVFKKSYGLADLSTGNPITEEANFNIGSLTKQFTAYALLDLCEKGKCSLHDSIGKYLHLPKSTAAVTVSQLLSHSSGIPDHYGFTDTFKVKHACLLYTSPSPRDGLLSRMPSSA